MPTRPITVREVLHNGRQCFYFNVPRSLSGGKLKRRFFSARSKAETEAARLESLREQHQHGYSILPLAERAMVGRLLEKLGGSVDELAKATDFYVQHHPREVKTVAELIADFIADRQRIGLSPKYIKPMRNWLAVFSLGFRGRTAQSVTAAELSTWLHGRGWSVGTIQTQLKHIRALYNFGKKLRLVAANPAESVERPKSTRKPPTIFTVEEAEAFMRAIEKHDPGLIQYVALVMFGGLRPDESAACKREFIGETVVDLPADAAKLRRRRIVELHDLPTLAAWLKVAPPFEARNMRKRLDIVRSASGVKWCADILRHTFVSYAVPIHFVAKTALMAEHSEAILNRHYRETVTRADAERFWKILPTVTKPPAFCNGEA